MVKRILLGGCLAVYAAAMQSAGAADSVTFEVTLAADAAERPSDGRLFVFLSQRDLGEPRLGPNWFRPEPFAGLDVRGFAPGEQRLIEASADAFPEPLAQLPPGHYRAQALFDRDLDHHHPGRAAGNLYSDVIEIDIPESGDFRSSIVLTRIVEARAFPASETVEELQLKSEVLSRFHGRDVLECAGVALPESYASQPERRYPVIYIIPGFGGSHRDAARYAAQRYTLEEGEVEFIRVMLSGDCKWGHHVYADSATNGPRATALVTEMIPEIERRYRTIAAPHSRFVTGHSSGGWSSLWLQVNYPDVFGGVWSTAPDPVDFRDFQRVNLYAEPPLSLYVDEADARRPIARRGGEASLYFDSFGKMDDVIKRGGQLRSFEAVFSPRGADGEPVRLWDRTTGRIDPAVAQTWEAYDIRLKLEREWPSLGPKLAGKLHIWTGELDTFFLEGAVKLLAQSLERLGSDAQVTVVPGKDHSSLLDAELARSIRQQMSAQFRASPAGVGAN